MEFEPSLAVWKSRGKDTVLDVSAVNGKDGSKLVLITTQDEVMEYCTQSRKCVNHWTFRAGSNLALRLGAVRNPSSQVCFGIRGSTTSTKKKTAESIVSWRNSDLEVAKWKQERLSDTSAVLGLFVHPQLTEEVVVVFSNGGFAVYDEDLVKVLDSTDGREELEEGNVVWASLASNHRNPMKGSLFLSLLVQSKDDASQYELVIYQVLSKQERQAGGLAVALLVRTSVQNESDKTAAVASCAFHAETFSYSVVWSTGDWQMVSFEHDPISRSLDWSSTQKIASFATDSSSVNLGSLANKKRKQNPTIGSTSIGYTSTGVGNYSYLVVSSASSPKTLIGWDSKFGVQVASTEIDFTSASHGQANGASSGVVGPMLRLLSSLNGEIVIAAYQHAVFEVNVKNKHSTLASVLGASSSSSFVAVPALPNGLINWDDVAAKKMDVAAWEEQLCADYTFEEQLIKDLSDPTVTSTAAQFTKKFNDSVEKLGKQGELSYRFLLAVTKRCVDSAKLGLWEPLKVMITSKRISARAVPSLLPVLMKYNQFELLELGILYLTDIDERSVVRLLKYFIRKSDDKAFVQYVATTKHNAGGKRKRSSDEPTQLASISPCERFLVALLALPTNNVFLHHAIREFQLEEVLFLLAICKKFFFALMSVNSAPVDGSTASKGKKVSKSKRPSTEDGAGVSPFQAIVGASSAHLYFSKLPSSFQFCSWICALIDGHFAQLVLAASKDTKIGTSLQHLDALVQLQLQSCEDYETVQSVLSNFLSGVKLPLAHGIPEYSIEILLI